MLKKFHTLLHEIYNLSVFHHCILAFMLSVVFHLFNLILNVLTFATLNRKCFFCESFLILQLFLKTFYQFSDTIPK